jgi:hypothetical protein
MTRTIGNVIGIPVLCGGAYYIFCYILCQIYASLNKPNNSLENIRFLILQKTGVDAIGQAIRVTAALLSLVVLPRLLPFTQVSYYVLPHFNWRWIEARLPS